jgi:hypothetical protein
MKNENQEMLKKMPVPYQALRYDLDALRAWTYYVTKFLSEEKLTRQHVKIITFVCLSESASYNKETKLANFYLYRATICADESGLDLIRLIMGVSKYLNKQ